MKLLLGVLLLLVLRLLRCRSVSLGLRLGLLVALHVFLMRFLGRRLMRGRFGMML